MFVRTDLALSAKKGRRVLTTNRSNCCRDHSFSCRGAVPARRAACPDTTAPDPTLCLAGQPWEYGPFVNGGFGTGNRADYKFLWAGVHAGKVLTGPFGKGCCAASSNWPRSSSLCGRPTRRNICARIVTQQPGGPLTCSNLFPTGGTYTGISVTPAILRWNLRSGHRFLPWIQGAGGLIWTNHNFRPIGPYPVPNHLGTSVFNFTPQFGVGVHYFVKPRQSISISANAVHISNASMGDSNPGVNASVQFSIGYTWWK